MKILFAFLILISALLSSSHATGAAFTVTNISNSNFPNDNPQINAGGWVTWEGWDGIDLEIFLYDGINIIQITDNSYNDSEPQINKNGWITWSGQEGTDKEIFLYNRTRIIPITSNSYDDFEPQINEKGWVTWREYDSDWEIFLYNGTQTIQLSDNSYDDFKPQINKNGWVTWYGYDGADWEIFLYNGSTVTNISNKINMDTAPQISDNGWVAWEGWDSTDREIFLYNGNEIIQITNNTLEDFEPRINSKGWVTWYGHDGADWEIFLYNGTDITQITDNNFNDQYCRINASGWIAWCGYDGADWEEFLYDGTRIVSLTDNPYNEGNPQISDSGRVTWLGWDGANNDIFLAKPPGAPPSPPSKLTAMAISSTQIVLGWKDNSKNEKGVKIQKKTGGCASAGTWTQIAQKPANTTSHTISGLMPHTTYAFRVYAYNDDGNSKYSNCASAKTGTAGAPRAPSDLKAISASSKKITLNWKDNSADETGFKIYRKAGPGAWSLLKTTAANAKTFSDTAALNHCSTTSYQYYIAAARKDAGDSPATNTATVPYQPTNLAAIQGTSSGAIQLTWTDKSTDETGYEIWRKPGDCSTSSEWTKVAVLGTNKTSWTNSGLSAGKKYSYKVRAYRKTGLVIPAYGYSMWSACKSVVAPS
jgi:hypothetical protein